MGDKATPEKSAQRPQIGREEHASTVGEKVTLQDTAQKVQGAVWLAMKSEDGPIPRPTKKLRAAPHPVTISFIVPIIKTPMAPHAIRVIAGT